MEEINKLDTSLYIDVYCYKCDKLCALSNTVGIDGRRYCNNCAELLPEYSEYIKTKNEKHFIS